MSLRHHLRARLPQGWTSRQLRITAVRSRHVSVPPLASIFGHRGVSRVRILFVSAEPIRPRQAGDTHVNEIATRLIRAGCRISICTTRVAGSYHRTPPLYRCLLYLAFWFQALRRLRQINVIYARAHPANFPIALAAWLMHIPIDHVINSNYYAAAITHGWLLL